MDTGLTYRILRGRLEDAFSADRIVFWGDFLHMAVYLRQTGDVLHRRMRVAASESDGVRMAWSAYLMGGADAETLGRTITYGTTLSMNTPADYLGDYGDGLARFHSGLSRVWHRDPYSAQIARLSRTDGTSCQGLDAAFLLGGGEPRQSDEYALVYFGRSDARPEALAAFGRRLVRRLGLKARVLPWGEAPAFWPMMGRRRFRAVWPELGGRGNRARANFAATYRSIATGDAPTLDVPPPGQLFEQIAGAPLVVTDTYHLAVNAWRLGVPAVIVVDGPTHEWNVNAGDPGSRRDKRVDLYSQLDALGLVVETSALTIRMGDVVERVAGLLEDHAIMKIPMRRVAAQSAMARAEFERALRA